MVSVFLLILCSNFGSKLLQKGKLYKFDRKTHIYKDFRNFFKSIVVLSISLASQQIQKAKKNKSIRIAVKEKKKIEKTKKVR